MNKKVKNIAMCGLFTAVIIVLTMITIPMPSGVPITLQTFAIALCGFMLGAKYSAVSVAAYVVLGTVGLPVFAGFKGGPGVLFGVTGGFIWGFILMALICGLGTKLKQKWWLPILGIGGLALCHILGILQFSIVSGNDLAASALIVSVPYLIKDIISVLGAFGISLVLKRALQKTKLI